MEGATIGNWPPEDEKFSLGVKNNSFEVAKFRCVMERYSTNK